MTNESKKQLGEKVWYTVNLETEEDSAECRVELLTGDYDSNSEHELMSSLEFVELVEEDASIIASRIWQHIRDNWDQPTALNYKVVRLTGHRLGSLDVTVTREEMEPSFSHSGCDICNDNMGNNVYDCIAYDDATKIDNGELWEIEVCSDCMYEYHYGECTHEQSACPFDNNSEG